MTFHFTNSIIINDDPFYVYGAGENVERNIIYHIIKSWSVHVVTLLCANIFKI